MIVKLEFLPEGKETYARGPLGDEIIRAIDRVMKGASWEKTENGSAWIAKR